MTRSKRRSFTGASTDSISKAEYTQTPSPNEFRTTTGTSVSSHGGDEWMLAHLWSTTLPGAGYPYGSVSVATTSPLALAIRGRRHNDGAFPRPPRVVLALLQRERLRELLLREHARLHEQLADAHARRALVGARRCHATGRGYQKCAPSVDVARHVSVRLQTARLRP